MILFDRIALLDAEHDPEMKLGIREARDNGNSFKILFWASIFYMRSDSVCGIFARNVACYKA